MSWFDHGTSRIYYEDSGTGAPVLMLPGWAMPIEGFGALRAAISAAGYRVIAADLPGSGRSLPQPRLYTAAYYDDDAQAFVALLQHLGASPAHLLGFSDGGEDALLMAELAPQIARSVITWGAGGFVSDPTGELRQGLATMVDQPIPPMQEFRDFLVGQYGEGNARAMTQSFAGALNEIINTRGGNLALLRADEIACPVLLMAGEHDMFIPLAILQQLAARLRTVETHVVPGAPHEVHDAQPEWLAQTVLDWLQRH